MSNDIQTCKRHPGGELDRVGNCIPCIDDVVEATAEKLDKEEQEGGMKIKQFEKPPVWDEAHRHFKLDDEHTVYTYGDTIYNPGGHPIAPDLEAHEATHADQQLEMEGGPAAWWKRYFADVAFRQEEELEAYRNQYTFYCRDHHDRNDRARFLQRLVRDLCGEMYNAGITQVEATKQIKRDVR